jgi:hypothetical protein
MSLGNYGKARKILFRGAQAVSRSSDGGLGNRRGLSELFHTWALCEWHLNNLPRAEVLFDHALRLTEAGEGGSKLRSFILYSISRLEYYRGELHLAQHCVGLSLKENLMPGGNAKVWELWSDIAKAMDNPFLEEECLEQAEFANRQAIDQNDISSLLSARPSAGVSRVKRSEMEHLMRREPWQFKLFGNTGKTSTDFFSSVKYPKTTAKSAVSPLQKD